MLNFDLPVFVGLKFLNISSGTIIYPDEDHKLNRRFFYSEKEIDKSK